MKRIWLVYASIVINKMSCDEMSRGSVDLHVQGAPPRRKTFLELVDTSSMKQSQEILTKSLFQRGAPMLYEPESISNH